MIDLRNKKLAIANFKMNLSNETEAEAWLKNFSRAKKDFKNDDSFLILCPPVIFLDKFVKSIKSEKISFGAQNCFWEKKGSFTGEISPEMIKSVGGEFVIIGHSERRRFLRENSTIANLKIKQALKSNLKPILCIGESEEEKKRDFTMDVILKQLRISLNEISKGLIEKVIICYEPVWAISANNPNHLPTVNEIMGAKLLIKKFLFEKYGENMAQKVKILYGGSVDSMNIEQICTKPETDGVLIGKTSLMPHELIKTIEMMR